MNIAIILSVFALQGSSIRVRNTQTTQHKGGLEFKVMFADNSTEPEVVTIFARQVEGEGLSPLVGGFSYDMTKPMGLRAPGVKDFITKILTDLPADVAQKLKTCAPTVKGNQNTANPPANKVYIMLTLEKLEPSKVETFPGWSAPGSKVLLIGQPPVDWDSGKKNLRHVYMPAASINFVEYDNKFTPMDLVNRDRPESKSMKFFSAKDDQHTYAYQHHNCKANRETYFDNMCKALQTNGDTCHALGRCKGTSGLAKLDDSHDDRSALSGGRQIRDEIAIGRYSKYKFVEAFENNAGLPGGHGYVTEKLMNALLSGAVPVYAGGQEGVLGEVFNEEAILTADLKDMQKTADRISYLKKHPLEYEAMVKAPAVSEEQMKKFFTWHPATWPEYGDGLRMQIINEILSLCALP